MDSNTRRWQIPDRGIRAGLWGIVGSMNQLPQLPITESLPVLVEALGRHNRVLLQAPPGAGKSTLLPLALLNSPWLASDKILMLEPRRIAARAVATRMAALLGESVGNTVGYRTRLDTRVSSGTRIEVVTEGILTRMLQENAELPNVACVIFDEFHERGLHADLGLALCLESQRNLRAELRIVVMSATLDLLSLSRLLDDAPIITASGRSFDVTTSYVPRRADLQVELQMVQVVRRALNEHAGDILCFLPGAAEIGRVQRGLTGAGLDAGVRVYPLYGELAGAAQDAALTPAPPGQRKIVLATTIAETSLTIEGIRVVVDAGLRRYAEFDPSTGMSRLMTGKVSQAAAEQRRGRAGRLSSGACYRLWSEGTQATLAPQTTPEIIHADLAPLALELACWGAADADSLTWLDPPPPAPLAQARGLLRQLDAIDAAARITPHGRELSRAGTHPRLAHMLVKGREFNAPRLASDLAAILNERDILRATAGARDVDLRLRVAALRGDSHGLPPGIEVDHRALTQAKRSAADWRRHFGRGVPEDADPHSATGWLLSLAYPDRIGRARGEGGRYVLANGRGAYFSEPQALAKAEFIVAAELGGAERDARIFLAAPVQIADIERHFLGHIVEASDIAWDARTEVIRARRTRRLAELLLESSELRHPDAGAMQAAALVGLRQMGVAALPWTADLRQWQARVALMRTYAVPAAEDWPDLTDESLAATLADWAPPFIAGFARREHLTRFDLTAALHSRLTYPQRAILEREAPTHFVVPSGSRIPIDYVGGAIPTLSVRLQELFGMTVTPAIACGRLALVLQLLSPAGRPVQITRDLVSFWNRGYHEVKKDLKGRYPKHSWPDDPLTALPTRRAKPR